MWNTKVKKEKKREANYLRNIAVSNCKKAKFCANFSLKPVLIWSGSGSGFRSETGTAINH
jgi:hypothetical protein